ncbi:MAG: hypothetical protein NTZ56_11780 [Acidobacteria bacterium]|nr:hypothetical protein [Acidobacteriota bacterium]
MRSLLLFLVACASLAAEDLTGIWIGRIPARNGELQEIAFQITQTGTKISGKLYGDYQSSPIIQGLVSDGLLTFVVASAEQAGNQINTARIRFTGKVKDGVMDLMREREAAIDAINGANADNRPTPKVSFQLKRLL